MEELNQVVGRHTFRWPPEAKELARAYLNRKGSRGARLSERTAVRALITQIAAVSGNPRGACWRFVRRLGVQAKPRSRSWTRPEQQRLLELIAAHSLREVTLLLRRSSGSVRSMLHRLGANARMGQDWFTKHALAEALHIRAEEVQKWIDRGWLKCRTPGDGGVKRQLIDADDFCEFCKQHAKKVVGNRLNIDRLNFVQTFVFPPSHAELLPVRSAKKEQEAYEDQVKRGADWVEHENGELHATA